MTAETKSEPTRPADPPLSPAGNGSFPKRKLSKGAEYNMQATVKPQTMNQTGYQPRSIHGPEKKIRSGAISAAIWANEQDTPTGRVTFRTVSFERTYKDKEGKWQSTNKLRSGDIPRAVLVLNKAYEYLALGEDTENPEH